MVNTEISQLLKENEGVVQLRPVPDVVSLEELPSQHASQLLESGWQKAYFEGGLDEEMSAFYAKLTIGKPLAIVQLDMVGRRLPESTRDRIEKNLAGQVSGDTRDDGFSLLPMLLARVEEDGRVDLTVCTDGTNYEDYCRDNPAAGEGNQRYEGTELLASCLEVVAMGGLYKTLTESSREILAGRIR